MAQGPTPREALEARLESILQEAVEPGERERARALLYGPGGVYNTRLVDARERMLDEVESAVAAFSRDMEVLQRYLSRTLEDGCITLGAIKGCAADEPQTPPQSDD